MERSERLEKLGDFTVKVQFTADRIGKTQQIFEGESRTENEHKDRGQHLPDSVLALSL